MSDKLAELPAELQKIVAINGRHRKTPLWLSMDLKKDVFVAEFPGIDPPIRAESREGIDEAAAIATHALNVTIIRGRATGVKWKEPANIGQPPKDADVRTIGVSY